MADRPDRARDYARVLLAGIRLFNGTAALLAPRVMARRLGVDPDANPAMIYVLRMFGIRTVIVGAELLRHGESRAWSLRTAPVIHASDAVAAAFAATTGRVPRRAGVVATLISTINTVLAIVAQPGKAAEARLEGRR